MKNVVAATFIFSVLLFLQSCKEECYNCNNICKECSQHYADTTLTTTVCSDVFGEEYYNEYLDSLTSASLKWTCVDASTTKSIRFCGGKTNNSIKLIEKKEQGWVCAGE